MENNDFDEKKMLESITNAEKIFEKALEYDDKKLRKKIEFFSKILDKLQEKPRKRILKKLAKKSGLPFEVFLMGISTTNILFKEALDNFDDNELREFIELYIKSGKEARAFLFGE